MRYPMIPLRKTYASTLCRFRGLNRQPGIGEGELAAMENMSADNYPVLSPRKPRGLYRTPASPQGLIALDRLCYVDGPDFVLGDTRVEMGLSVAPEDCPKQLQAMGAYVIILPDKKYINTQDITDLGDIEARVTVTGATVSLCRSDGGEADYTPGGTPPENPENGALWLDTSQSPPALSVYSAAQGSWSTLTQPRVKISAPGIGRGFSPFDAVVISGCREESLNGTKILWAVEEDAVLLEGILEKAFTQEEPISLHRRMPILDHTVQSGNRLWGCRFGPDRDGNPVNQIYASKLGDFKNWECFMGLSTDSYSASCGTPGPFTGAAAFPGNPLFFKEDCVHRVYGSEPASFCVLTNPCRGVQPGCAGSLAQVGELLLYKSRFGVCAYDGAAAQLISRELGAMNCTGAVAGALGDKYYLCLKNGESRENLVWDSSRGLWHREDDLDITALCPLGQELYAIDGGSRNILGLLGTGETEGPVHYMAQTGPMGLGDPEQKHLARLDLRLSLEPGSRMEILARYDSLSNWELLGMIFSRDLRSVRLPLRPRRCDHLEIMLRGTGGMKVYSITRIYEKGSDQL